MSMIRVEKLSKAFGSLQVLKDVNLTVEKGERIVIIGGSGCGKSVFLRCMDFLETPDEGAVFIGEDELTSNQKDLNRIRRKVGMVFQGFHLFSHMNVLDNITLAPVKLLGLPREEAEKKAEELLKMVGLESKKYTMPDRSRESPSFAALLWNRRSCFLMSRLRRWTPPWWERCLPP